MNRRSILSNLLIWIVLIAILPLNIVTRLSLLLRNIPQFSLISALVPDIVLELINDAVRHYLLIAVLVNTQIKGENEGRAFLGLRNEVKVAAIGFYQLHRNEQSQAHSHFVILCFLVVVSQVN